VLVHLIGPEAIKNGEIYSAANDREQAAQVFKVAAQMVRADPELLALGKVVDSTKSIACYGNGSFYRAISAEAGTKHGLNPTVVIFDELAQAKSRELYDVLDTSMGARAEPLFITISTQSNDPEHILSKLIDDGLNAGDPTICVHLYAVPDDCPDIFNRKVWKLANPALGDFRSAADFQALADKAKRNPAEEPKFRNLFLNQRYSADSPLISRVDWKACQGNAGLVDGEEIYLALDNASTTDLASLVAVSAKNGDRVAAWFWKPAALVEEHSKRDFGTGTRRYEEWAEAGWLELTPGRSIQPVFIVAKVAEIASRYRVLGLAYDRWRIADFLRHLADEGVEASAEGGDGIPLVAWGQGFKDMAPAVDAFERAVIEGTLRHPGSPVLTWNVGNAVVVTDPAGNRKLDKQKARFRIDGAIAAAMAMGLKARAGEREMDISDFLSAPIVAMRRG
jgi:phage terminase large subunit-like protein